MISCTLLLCQISDPGKLRKIICLLNIMGLQNGEQSIRSWSWGFSYGALFYQGSFGYALKGQRGVLQT